MNPISYRGRVTAISIQDTPEGIVDVTVEADADYYVGMSHLRIPENMQPKLGSEILWTIEMDDKIELIPKATWS